MSACPHILRLALFPVWMRRNLASSITNSLLVVSSLGKGREVNKALATDGVDSEFTVLTKT